MKMTSTFDNTLTGRITGLAAQLILEISILTASTVHAAKVVAIDPPYGVKGSTVVAEGTSWTFTTNTVTADSGNNRIATIRTPPHNRDYYFQANPGTLDTTVYRYAQVFYSLNSNFVSSVHELYLQTSAQSPLAKVQSFLNSTLIPSTSGSHSFIIDLLDGTTSIGTNGYSGNLTLFRYDFFNNDSGDDGKALTLDRIVFASGLIADPDRDDTVRLFDNFNTSNGSATNDLATRQSGTLAPESYDAGLTISSGMLPVGSGGDIACNADVKANIKDTQVDGFKLSFDAAYTGGAGQWSSPYLSTHPPSPDERAASKFGILIYQNGTIEAYGTVNKSAGPAALTNLLGSWNVTATNNFALVTTPATATNGTYNVFINGTKAISDVSYTIGTGGTNGEVNWQVRNPSGGGAKFDNLYASTFVIPPSGTVLIIR